MLKRKIVDESGVTLLELLITLGILTFLGTLTFGVFASTMNYNEKTQSHINLRQEANIVVSTLRAQHQQDEYSFCSDSLLANDNITFHELTISDSTNIMSKEDPCASFQSSEDLNVKFTIMDYQNNNFEIDTIISGRASLVVTDIVLPKPGNPGTENPDTEEPGTENPGTENPGTENPGTENPDNFYDYLVGENVFVYGKSLEFQGNQMIGPDATMVIFGDLFGNKINGGALSRVSNIYIDGTVEFNGGGAGLGSNTNPGAIYVNGDFLLKSGGRNVYGDVYVKGNSTLKDATLHQKLFIGKNAQLIGGTFQKDIFIDGNAHIKDANIQGNAYIKGNVTLDWTPNLGHNTTVFYEGTLTHPENMSPTLLSKFKKVITIPNAPNADNLEFEMPPLQSSQWFAQKGYSQQIKPDNMKYYGGNVSINSYYDNSLKRWVNSYQNATVISTGDINVNGGDLKMTGILIAPNGKVTFHGSSFEGLVISKEGFFVSSGGTTVTFRNIQDYIKDVQDFPFKIDQ